MGRLYEKTKKVFALQTSTQIYDNNTYIKEYTYLGIVNEKTNDNECILYQRNKFCVGDEVEVMRFNGENIITKVVSIKDEDGNEMESCPHPKQKIFVDLGIPLSELDLLRRKEPDA